VTAALEDLPLVLTVVEVAAELRCARWCVYEMVKRGDLRAVHVGRNLRIPRAELGRFLAGERA